MVSGTSRSTSWIGKEIGGMVVLCCVTAPKGTSNGDWMVRCKTCGAINVLSGSSLSRRDKYPELYKNCCEISRYGKPRKKRSRS